MKLLDDQKRQIAKMFPGVKTDNGPAINETCIYTVILLLAIVIPQLHCWFRNCCIIVDLLRRSTYIRLVNTLILT